MTFRIRDIKSQLQFGGARPSLFNVNIYFPAGLSLPGVERQLSFLAKASSLPVSTLSAIEVPYFGRRIKLAGTRTYPEWTITVINDEDFKIRRAFQDWMEYINDPVLNLRIPPVTSRPRTYKDATGLVTQWAKDKSETNRHTIRLEGLFPTEVAAIDLGWDKGDEIEEFTVTFAYDLWVQTNEEPAFGESTE